MKKTAKFIANLSELSRLEGVARSTATRWDKDGLVIRSGDGRIDVSSTRRIIRERERDPQAASARARLLMARVGREELRLSRERGESVPLALVGPVWQRATGVFRSRMLAIPRKAVPRLRGATRDAAREKVLQELIHEALNELAARDYSPDVAAAVKEAGFQVVNEGAGGNSTAAKGEDPKGGTKNG